MLHVESSAMVMLQQQQQQQQHGCRWLLCSGDTFISRPAGDILAGGAAGRPVQT